MNRICTFYVMLLLCCSIYSTGQTKHFSEIKKDEIVVLFNTSAWLNEATKQWHIPIHGWVYEPEDSKFRKAIIESTLESIYNLQVTQSTEKNFNQRTNLLLADNESGKSIHIQFAGRSYAIPKSITNGHFKHELLIDENILKDAKIKNQLAYSVILPKTDHRVYTGQVNLIKPHGVSIISDIDDTIKISEVTERSQLLKHTFLQDFKAVTGINKLYQQWLTTDGALHFVSSSPWQLYTPLVNFIEKTGFPDADYHLKSFRFKDKTLLNLFAQSSETKPPQIIHLLKKYPFRKFILVGDSGELDPEIYAQIQQQFPEQIIQILIRNVTNESPENLRFQSLYKNISPDLWQLFKTADQIKFNPTRLSTTKYPH